MRWKCVAVLLFVWFTVSIGYAETIRFAPLPMQDRETIIKQCKPMIVYLEKNLHVQIIYDYSDNYSDLLDKFRRSQVDLAYLGPLPYVELRATYAHAEPLVHFKEKSGNASYTCAMATFPDAGFEMQFAVNRKIALTQPLSTCGYLSVSGLMRNHGSDLEANRYRYLGRHDAVALSIIQGEFEAGGLKSAIAREYAHMGLRIIAETDPLPAFALVGNAKTLTPERMFQIQSCLTILEPDGKDKSQLESWGKNIRYGAVTASDDDYRPVRELLGYTKIPEKSNF